MPSLNEIISMITMIYSDVIEPLFCLFYAYILIRICLAKSSDFRSAFYMFSIGTGICAIGNVLMNLILRFIDVRFQYFPDRGVFCTILMWASHIFALAISIGKTLSVSTRFTSIYLVNRRDFWEGRKVKICLIVMFGIPFALYAYFPLLPAAFGPTPNGYGVYLGISNPGFMARMSVGRHEKVLALYAVVLTTSHLFKSILQSIWFFALVSNQPSLQTTIISMYLIPNTLSAFAEPVLLLITSQKLRNEVFPWLSTGTSISTRTTVATSTHAAIQNQSPRVQHLEMTQIVPSIRLN